MNGAGHLVIPHQFDNNDTKFVHTNGFAYGGPLRAVPEGQFLTSCTGKAWERPKLMTVSLHSRIVGRPGRIRALERFLDYVLGHDRVWIPTREEIARHWMETHPYRPPETA